LKKLVFADPMSEAVDRVFDISAVNISAGDYLLAIYGFALQIYCDFSGYTDMAVGAAILLGVKLPTNFQRPYIAASLVEFWTRWHITLSKWLRDYLYIPLGGNKSGYGQQAINLFITMALGGLWHGASWTFVLWGISHGAGISFTHAIRRFRGLQWLGRLPHFIKVLITFHFVAASWILFRSPDLQTAWRVAKGPFLAPWTDFMPFLTQNIFPLVLLTIFFITHRWDDHRTIRTAIKKLPKSLFWPALALIWMLAITVSQGSSAKFIYFDF
jgi:alginate O-acetyltransferase complex protein AlgI